MVRGRSGRPWNRIRSRIQAETTNCWRCGKAISGQYKWPHPLSVTVGHLIAYEDCARLGLDPEDPSLLAGECIACNMADGARRRNARSRGRQRQSKRSGRW